MRNEFSKWLKTAFAGAAILTFVFVNACRESAPPANREPAPPAPTEPTPAQPGIAPVDAPVTQQKLGFDHVREEHKLDCTICHIRPDNEPTPSFPGHTGCIDCHSRDFTAAESQLCSICHTTPVDAAATLVSFPARLGQFGLKGFSHRDHMDPAKMPQGTQPARCDDCHRFDARGVNATYPSHAECYSCHTHQASQPLGECASCHVDSSIALRYTKGVGSPFSQYNFKHGTHNRYAACDRCHQLLEVAAGEIRSDIQKISTARGQRHQSSCWSCHSQAREPLCTKCHVGTLPF